LVLECDHIDGVPTNHNPSNLRLICPNCHSQTNTFKGRNK
jgi:5-methylcytosine-specific restriction endonuclease McrA